MLYYCISSSLSKSHTPRCGPTTLVVELFLRTYLFTQAYSTVFSLSQAAQITKRFQGAVQECITERHGWSPLPDDLQ